MTKEWKKPWNGRRGLILFVFFTSFMVGFNWLAWIGGPAGFVDGVPHAVRNAGSQFPTTRTLYFCGQVALAIAGGSILGIIVTFVYNAAVPNGTDIALSS